MNLSNFWKNKKSEMKIRNVSLKFLDLTKFINVECVLSKVNSNSN